MRKTIRRTALGATLGLAALGGCDSNPNGPTFPDVPVAKQDADSSQEQGQKGKGRRKNAPIQVIADPAK